MNNSQQVHHRNFASLSIVTTIRVLIVSSIIMIATDRIEAALIISVEEDTVNNVINFSWNGIIGDSGNGALVIAASAEQGADFLVPSGQWDKYVSVADRSRGDVGSTGTGDWDPIRRFAGTSNAYGSGYPLPGASFSDFVVTGNTSWAVTGQLPNQYLYVGAVTDGGSDVPDLATHTFTGSFTLPGDFATYGLFDTVGTDISAGPVTLWTATTGSGEILFQVVPEPSTGLLSLLGLAGCILARSRRRSVRG